MTWIQTQAGVKFDLLNPKPEHVFRHDIAYALSALCRYTGHCNRHYSVAEHCVRVSFVVSCEAALWGLLHDAHEAYIGDLSAPLKAALRALWNTGYDKIADDIDEAIIWKLMTAPPTDEVRREVKEADLRMLQTERLTLLGPAPESWRIGAEPYPWWRNVRLGWSRGEAEHRWMQRYRELACG